MISSLRRIGTALFVVAVFTFGGTLIASNPLSCPSGFSCMGALTFLSINDDHPKQNTFNARSTLSMTDGASRGIDPMFINQVIQQTSMYTLLFAIAVLLSLEMKEIHYLKSLIYVRKRRHH